MRDDHGRMAGEGFAVGDKVLLRRGVDTFDAGTAGTVIGFLRLPAEKIVVSVDDGSVLKLPPEDLEHAR